MFVCMFYLSPRSRIIVSIWETSELQRENKRSKRERERERRSRSLVSSLQTLCIVYSLKLCGNFVTFFCFFYILYNREGAFTRALEWTFITFVSFLFLSFLFLEDLRRQRLELLSLLSGLHCKETRGAPGQVRLFRHVDVVFFFFRCFRVGISPYFFRITVLALAKVIRLLLALQREMCFTQNIRSRVTWKRKEK